MLNNRMVGLTLGRINVIKMAEPLEITFSHQYQLPVSPPPWPGSFRGAHGQVDIPRHIDRHAGDSALPHPPSHIHLGEAIRTRHTIVPMDTCPAYSHMSTCLPTCSTHVLPEGPSGSGKPTHTHTALHICSHVHFPKGAPRHTPLPPTPVHTPHADLGYIKCFKRGSCVTTG